MKILQRHIWPFELVYSVITINTHDQVISLFFGFAQDSHVSDMQNIPITRDIHDLISFFGLFVVFSEIIDSTGRPYTLFSFMIFTCNSTIIIFI